MGSVGVLEVSIIGGILSSLWVAQDARKKNINKYLAIMLALTFFPLGFIIYLFISRTKGFFMSLFARIKKN